MESTIGYTGEKFRELLSGNRDRNSRREAIRKILSDRGVRTAEDNENRLKGIDSNSSYNSHHSQLSAEELPRWRSILFSRTSHSKTIADASSSTSIDSTTCDKETHCHVEKVMRPTQKALSYIPGCSDRVDQSSALPGALGNPPLHSTLTDPTTCCDHYQESKCLMEKSMSPSQKTLSGCSDGVDQSFALLMGVGIFLVQLIFTEATRQAIASWNLRTPPALRGGISLSSIQLDVPTMTAHSSPSEESSDSIHSVQNRRLKSLKSLFTCCIQKNSNDAGSD